MALVSDIITQAFQDLAVIQPGETISTAMQTAAFLMFQQLVRSWASERYMNRTTTVTFQPLVGVSSYSVGDGGGFDTGLFSACPLLIGPGFMSRSGAYRNGGKVVSYAEFDATVKDGLGTSSVLAQVVAGNQGLGLQNPNSSPLPTVKIWPTPAAAPGLLDLDLLMPLSLLQFSAVSDALTGFPPGWERAFHLNLAMELYPQYQRNADPTVLAAKAQDAKAVLVEIGRMALGEAGPQAA